MRIDYQNLPASLEKLNEAMAGLYGARYRVDPLSPWFGKIVHLQDELQRLIIQMDATIKLEAEAKS